MDRASNPLERVRVDCAEVASRSTHVRIDHERLHDYADTVIVDDLVSRDPGRQRLVDDETTAAFVLTLDGINFGSGWFPHLVKRPGMSGYHTVAACWRDRWAAAPLTAEQLCSFDASTCRNLFGQQSADEHAQELMGLFAAALVELGAYVVDRFAGSFSALIEAAHRSAASLAALLAECSFYADVAHYDGRPVALYKRAQISSFDLHRALAGRGLGRFDDLDRLTMFADNLVPHVLRLDGVLEFEPSLVERIDRGELIESGSEEEVEIRACAVHAVELLVGELGTRPTPTNAGTIDGILWERGGEPRYKSVPRHRTRCVFY